MSKKEILEGNKLIAEFMGFIWEEKYNGYYKPNPKWTIHSKEKAWIEKIDGKKRLKYHSSWDWLMPVVEKIKELGWQFHLNSYSVSNDARFINVKTGSTIQNIAWSTPLLATYNVVIDFIKWYNLKQQS